MRYVSLESKKDELLLAARVLMMILFVLFGWQKLTGFSGTVAYMASTGNPAPSWPPRSRWRSNWWAAC